MKGLWPLLTLGVLANLLAPAPCWARQSAMPQLMNCIATCTEVQLQNLLKHQKLAPLSPERRAAMVAQALEKKNAATLRALLAWGVDVNAPMPFNMEGERLEIRPLMYALSAGAGLPAVRALVSGGADVNLASSGQLPLNWALSAKQYEVATYLLDQGADPKRTDDIGVGALTALAVGARDADAAQISSMARRLVGQGADVNATNVRSVTALGMAVAAGHLGLVETLLTLGANPNTRNSQGESPLAVATRRQQTDIAQALTRHGAQP